MFSFRSKLSLAKATVFQNKPVYVQFYITARCNLTCEQCNIIYANADLKECTISEIEKIADNFSKIGVAIVLLTGGEPFARTDLHKIIYAFESRGIHVRMQTNGFSSEEMIIKCIDAGGKDISISLDSLDFSKQDEINGNFKNSSLRALKTISLFTKYLSKKNSFASLGCVLSPKNMNDITDVIKFGTKIGWFTSLVPIHVTDSHKPLGFRTFDQSLKFKSSEFSKINEILNNIKQMKSDGYLLYDSDQYLNDVERFIKNEKTTWRSKNQNDCDSPNLYFAILPNGEFAPCCDYRTKNSYRAYDADFKEKYLSNNFFDEVKEITKKCEGCMYGSYPEITISMRFFAAKIQRIKNFFTSPPKKKWPIEYDEILNIANEIRGGNAKKN
jgi:MoaA/NifB/PqqE/SkfB family radical SAM enzyme